MKKFVVRVLLFIISTLTIVFTIFFVILKLIPPQFGDLYQSEMISKIERLQSIKGKKIIYLSGSSGAFCIDSKQLEKDLQMQFVNLGLHAGFGQYYVNEIAKDYIKNGDIVIISHELSTYYTNYYVPEGGIALLATSINDHYEYLKYFSDYEKKEFFKYIPSYAFTKLDKIFFEESVDDPIYSSNAFNEYGDIDQKLEYLEGNQFFHDIEKYTIYFDNTTISELNDFIDYATNNGVKVVLNFPFMNTSDDYEIDYNHIKQLENSLTEKLKIKSLYPLEFAIKKKEYFFDTANHCSSLGKEKYTNLLIKSLKKYIEENDL